MQVRTRHTPAFGVARLMLAPGEAVQADYSALLATSFGVLVDQRRGGGRSKGRPTVFTAPAEGGWVDVAPGLPGEVYALDLDGTAGWCVARGVGLAVASTLRVDPSWPNFHTLFGAEHGFLEHVSGVGTIVLAVCGALDVATLEPGEAITVGPASVLAYSDGTQTRLRAVSQSGPQSVRTGEGLMLDFAGPGRLLTQTRTPRAMAGWLAR
ncbi:AIM24 family protein [Actinokineospora xionganensis]|uniref:AIM24 family protein n=1 Tax=Actinokineospora xionganensis TaxID=2684470 RepID=A0ABR7L3S9_9PSEU|nr:AIM24 family protein [Actinokineospora xionganensis]MBC6447168.1 AIM24 family protein [Actinokineospora xionganensis]